MLALPVAFLLAATAPQAAAPAPRPSAPKALPFDFSEVADRVRPSLAFEKE